MRSAEENLWAAVVIRAAEDATALIKNIEIARTINGPTVSFERDLAYLTEQLDSDWFYLVCEWAGIHQDYVIRLIKEKTAGLYD